MDTVTSTPSEVSKKPPTIRLPMVCVCSDEGKAHAEELMTEVMTRLGGGSEELSPCHVDAGNFLTTVVVSLHWDYDSSIEGIYNDQWSGVVVERYTDRKRIYIECDYVEHGIAAIWKAIADGAFGDSPDK